MRLTVVGCSPAWPNPGGAQSGYLVEGAGSLLLDCGPGVLARLRERGGWPSPDAIAITHLHLDHFGDLVPWVWGTAHLEQTVRAQLWVPHGGRERLATIGSLLGFPEMFERTFELHEYEHGVAFDAAGFRVTATRVPHYGFDAHGLRVTDGVRILAYSGDSAPDDALAELARDADLFLCEATLERGDLDADPRGHLSLEEALASFRASGARRLLVTHRPAELPGDGAELAHDGLVCEV